jgi:type II secretory pathway pseudopilin PulG
MKNYKYNNSLGVTLLEIMLVLAISASIIIMSVRYYGSATSSLQTNNTLQQIQAITAAIDSYTFNGSYADVTTPLVKSLLPQNTLTTPWGTAITISSAKSSSYEVTLPNMPLPVCTMLYSKLASNNHYQIARPCSQTMNADFVYSYVANA